MIVSIKNANYIEDYIINFVFSDGVKQTINFADFLKNAKNPMTKKYLDKELFKSFSIEYGDVLWNNYEMCFPVWDLHEGVI